MNKQTKWMNDTFKFKSTIKYLFGKKHKIIRSFVPQQNTAIHIIVIKQNEGPARQWQPPSPLNLGFAPILFHCFPLPFVQFGLNLPPKFLSNPPPSLHSLSPSFQLYHSDISYCTFHSSNIHSSFMYCYQITYIPPLGDDDLYNFAQSSFFIIVSFHFHFIQLTLTFLLQSFHCTYEIF